MRPTFLFALLLSVVAPAGAHALTITGNASAQADAGPSAYLPLPGPESTTGPATAAGNCSQGAAQAWVSVSGGSLALAVRANGGATQTCIANSSGSGNSTWSDSFLLTSATLPAGTPVTLTLCVTAALRTGVAFACGGSVYEGVTSTAGVTVGFNWFGQNLTASGTYSERWNCYDGHQRNTAGLFAPGSSTQTLVLANVPVGSIVGVSGSLSAASGGASFFHPEEGHVECALVWGYTANGPAQLLSLDTQAECSTRAACSPTSAAGALPPSPSPLAAPAPGTPAHLALAAPFPNPASGPFTVRFALPVAGAANLALYDVAGARVATLADGEFAAGEQHVTWNGLGATGRRPAAGLYWLRLEAAGERVSRMVVLRP